MDIEPERSKASVLGLGKNRIRISVFFGGIGADAEKVGKGPPLPMRTPSGRTQSTPLVGAS